MKAEVGAKWALSMFNRGSPCWVIESVFNWNVQNKRNNPGYHVRFYRKRFSMVWLLLGFGYQSRVHPFFNLFQERTYRCLEHPRRPTSWTSSPHFAPSIFTIDRTVAMSQFLQQLKCIRLRRVTKNDFFPLRLFEEFVHGSDRTPRCSSFWDFGVFALQSWHLIRNICNALFLWNTSHTLTKQ